MTGIIFNLKASIHFTKRDLKKKLYVLTFKTNQIWFSCNCFFVSWVSFPQKVEEPSSRSRTGRDTFTIQISTWRPFFLTKSGLKFQKLLWFQFFRFSLILLVFCFEVASSLWIYLERTLMGARAQDLWR